VTISMVGLHSGGSSVAYRDGAGFPRSGGLCRAGRDEPDCRIRGKGGLVSAALWRAFWQMPVGSSGVLPSDQTVNLSGD